MYNILYYYHVIQRCVKHLPQIRSQNSEIKAKSNDLLTNIKILLLIHSNKKEDYYNKMVPIWIYYPLVWLYPLTIDIISS